MLIQSRQTWEWAGLWLVTNGRGHLRMRVIFPMGRCGLGVRVGECSGMDGVYCLLGEVGGRDREEGEVCDVKRQLPGTLLLSFKADQVPHEQEGSFPHWVVPLGSSSVFYSYCLSFPGSEITISIHITNFLFFVKANGSPESQIVCLASFNKSRYLAT